MGVFERISKTVKTHPWGIIIVAMIVTVILGMGLMFLKGQITYQSLLPEGFPSVKALQTLDKEFGGIAYEQVLIRADSVTDPEVITFLTRLGDTLKEDPRFNRGQITRSEDYLTYFTFEMKKRLKEMGLTTLPDGAVLKPFVEKDYLSLPYADKWLFGRFISKDKKAALVMLKTGAGLSEEQQVELAEDLEELFKTNLIGVSGLKLDIAGDATLARDFDRHIKRKTVLLFVVAIAFVILALFLSFRRFSDTMLPVAFMLLGLVWTFGFTGWIGIPYSIASIAIMPILLGTALTFVVPFAARYYEEIQHHFRSVTAVGKALMTVGVGLFLAALTNIFGFLVFEFSVMPPLRDFGLSCAVGTIFIFLLAVTLLPAIMVVRDRVYEKSPEELRARLKTIFDGLSRRRKRGILARGIDHVLEAFTAVSTRHPIMVVVVFAALIFAGFSQIGGLTTDSDLRQLVPRRLPGIDADFEIEQIFGGQQQDVVMVSGDVLSPESLEAMTQFEDGVADDSRNDYEGQELYPRSGILGLPDVIADANEGKMPATSAEVEKTIKFIENSGGSLEGLLSTDGKSALVTLNGKGAQSTDVVDRKLGILNRNGSEFIDAAGLSCELAGITPLTKDMTKNIIPTETWSSILSLVLCALVLIIIFRSVPFGLITLTVALAGVAAEIGFLSLMNWPLDVITSLVSALVIGIGVNFGILFTHRFIQEIDTRDCSPLEAVRNTMLNLGRANAVAASATVAAFLIIMLSDIVPLKRFGGATAFAIAWCLVTSLTLMPALLYRLSGHRQEEGEKEQVLNGDMEPETT